MRVISADLLALPALTDLFNAGFSDYIVPMRLHEPGFRDHLANNDIDPACSPVVVEEEPVAFALVGLRGKEAWIGGMGTVPERRRRGLGEKALVAAIEAARARGAASIWLEVIEGNRSARRLYEKLGFELVRDLIVWSLPAGGDAAPASRPLAVEEAQEWIARHRTSREPWQRSDSALRRMAGLRALMVERQGVVIYRPADASVTALQVAGPDEEAIAAALLAAQGGTRELRLANVPADGPASTALERLGARPVVRQHEMRLAL